VGVCPDTGRFPADFWNGPGFDEGKNIFCAVDDEEELLGYAALSPSYVSRHLQARILWLDLRVDPERVDAEALKDILFWRAYVRAHEIARQMEDEQVAISATYFATGQASIDYLKSKGFTHYQTCCTMRREMPPAGLWCPLRRWR
jgi:hypothetical protein